MPGAPPAKTRNQRSINRPSPTAAVLLVPIPNRPSAAYRSTTVAAPPAYRATHLRSTDYLSPTVSANLVSGLSPASFHYPAATDPLHDARNLETLACPQTNGQSRAVCNPEPSGHPQ